MERAKALDDKGHLCRADCLAFSFGSSATSAPWSLTLMLLLRPADVPSHIVRTQPTCTPSRCFQGLRPKKGSSASCGLRCAWRVVR